ncbi:uncharacterized protein LOC142339638 [Convolutriloba macropyga]|uniref:uncharacterized protein LOC142339638 n=1 Tax=Convolutriloba macropyga TaxID=536237 RepID=UPI003F51B5D5
MSSSNSQLSSSEQLDRVPNGGQSGSGAVANGKGPITKPFWELDGYKEVMKRSQNSNNQLTALKKMLEERAQCEKAYADSLFKWSLTWKKAAESGPEEEHFREAWIAFTKEADAVREIHMEIANNLRAVRKTVSDWQLDNYKKSHTLKNIEKGFKNTQDLWADKLKRVNDRQNKYYSACKEEHNVKQKNKTQSVSEQSDEQKRKAQQRENKAHNDVLAAQEKYKKAVNELHGDRDRHRRDMENQFGHAQDFEKNRLMFTKQSMVSMCGNLNVAGYSQYPAIYPFLHNLVSKASIEDDLSSFAQKRRFAAELTFPSYQEWTIEMAGPSISNSTRGAASLKAVEAAVAFGNNKGIDGEAGSYRLRADTSPPAQHTHTTNTTSTSGASLEKSKTQTSISASSMASLPQHTNTMSSSSPSSSPHNTHLPPPPESTSLPAVPKTVTTTTTTTSVSSTPKQEKTKTKESKTTNNNLQPTTKSSSSGSNNKSGTLDITNPFKFNTIQRDDAEYDNPFDHNSDHEDRPDSGGSHVYSAVGDTKASSNAKPVVPPARSEDEPDYDDDANSVSSADHSENEGGYDINVAASSSVSGSRETAGPSPMPRGVSVLNPSQRLQNNNDNYDSEDDAPGPDNGVYSNGELLPDSEQPEVNGAGRASCGSVVRDDAKVEFDEGVRVKALYAYEADEEDEISLEAGEEFIKLADADENGWAYGFRRNRYGLYPASYAEEI